MESPMSARTTDARNQLLRFTISTISLDFLLHSADCVSHFFGHLRSAASMRAGLPSPKTERCQEITVSGLTRMRASDHLHTDPSPCPNIQVRPPASYSTFVASD